MESNSELQRILDFNDELVIVIMVIYLLAVQRNYTTQSDFTLRRCLQMISDEKSHTIEQSHQSQTLLFSRTSHLCEVHYRLLNAAAIL